MKKTLILIGVLMLVAAPLYAFVQPGSLVAAGKLSSSDQPRPMLEPDQGPQFGPQGTLESTYPISGAPVDETATEPVPEPGTMVMASMGLLALSAALRRNRGH